MLWCLPDDCRLAGSELPTSGRMREEGCTLCLKHMTSTCGLPGLEENEILTFLTISILSHTCTGHSAEKAIMAAPYPFCIEMKCRWAPSCSFAGLPITAVLMFLLAHQLLSRLAVIACCLLSQAALPINSCHQVSNIKLIPHDTDHGCCLQDFTQAELLLDLRCVFPCSVTSVLPLQGKEARQCSMQEHLGMISRLMG